ncbi:methyltransferase type 11 [Gordoniibacillus kamchatkensis]|uniref:Methyltransferase type 11 n=1 Tax=Gordoniibacillus kamchatkensis TaxID=1590651 RepID=A0ABR5AJ52_9BACL|nr:class I SAM-dependent methyltransferase [Paenibacillus sp. VKM B-2647]KIL41083.1 methyltransferase type 11 [Paenibacillus sp. VKM B-2647]
MEYLEMLARLGVGSAHPGGFAATVAQLREHPIAPGCRILEVGCGTGRTSCYLAKLGYEVTALDLREDMLAKARRRASGEEVRVTFLQGNVEELPLPDEQYDVVMAESVTIFADVSKALREYARVLRPGGKLYDREILAARKLTSTAAQAICDFYGVKRMYAEKEWLELLGAAGFSEAKVWQPSKFPESAWEDIVHYPDLFQETDADAYENEAVWETAKKYDELMFAYHEFFGFGLMIGSK